MKYLHHLAHVQSLSFPLRYERGTKINAKTVTIDLYREWPQTRKALGVSALTIECEICWVFLIGNHLPTQFQTAVEYQRLADRWFKFRVRVTLDPVSALNSWWNSGSSFGLSFGLSFFNFERCYSGAFSCIFHAFDVSKVPVLLPLYEVLLLTWGWAKIAKGEGSTEPKTCFWAKVLPSRILSSW